MCKQEKVENTLVIQSTEYDCYVNIISYNIQLALTRVLLWLGLKPDGLLGHSVGELGCAYADGTLSVEQIVAAAYWRGQSIKDAELTNGAMAAVGNYDFVL